MNEGNNLELIKKRVKSLKRTTMERDEIKHEEMPVAKKATILEQRAYRPYGLNTLLP